MEKVASRKNGNSENDSKYFADNHLNLFHFLDERDSWEVVQREGVGEEQRKPYLLAPII